MEFHFFAEHQELIGVVLDSAKDSVAQERALRCQILTQRVFFRAKVGKSEPPGFHYKRVSHHSEGGSDQIHLIFFNLCWQSVKLVARRLKEIRAYFAQVVCVINVEGFSPVHVLSLQYELRLARLGL